MNGLVHVVRQMVGAVQYLHTRGIVHRRPDTKGPLLFAAGVGTLVGVLGPVARGDVKPENFLIDCEQLTEAQRSGEVSMMCDVPCALKRAFLSPGPFLQGGPGRPWISLQGDGQEPTIV